MQVSGIRRVAVLYEGSESLRAYAFDTDLPVKIGSRVLVPGSAWKPGDQTARVVNLESNYGGPCKWIRALLDN